MLCNTDANLFDDSVLTFLQGIIVAQILYVRANP